MSEHVPESYGLQEYPRIRYGMGFSVNGYPIPDPATFSCNESDLDTMGERDATGYLHRNMVASKWNMKIGWTALPWETLTEIGQLVKGPKFNFTFPNPFADGGKETIEAYAGDRSVEDKWSPENSIWLGDMSFSVIQY